MLISYKNNLLSDNIQTKYFSYVRITVMIYFYLFSDNYLR